MKRGISKLQRAVCVAVAGTIVAWARPEAVGQIASTGVIRGHVRLTAPAPPNPVIRMGADPACSQLNAGRRPVHEYVVRNADGGLANAFVHVQGRFAPTPPAAPVVLEQRGCVYQPHVVGLQVGQLLRVTNADPTLHNVHSLSIMGNEFNVSQPSSGAAVTFAMKGEEMMLRVTCDIHSWMNIFVGVVNHPYFAVSRADGRFEIAGVPAGRQTVEVWHERYGPLVASVDVSSGAPSIVDFTYQGTEKAAPPSAVAAVVVPGHVSTLLIRPGIARPDAGVE